MPSYVSVRLEACSPGKAGGLARHDVIRPPYADPSRRDQNKVWAFAPSGGLPEEGQKADISGWGKYLRGQLSKKSREQSRNLFVAGIITLSRDPDDREKARQAAFATVKDIAQKMGGVRVVQVGEHSDEKTLHWHFLLSNVAQGKMALRRLGRDGFAKAQDIAGEHFAPLGFSRGKRGSRRKHYSVAEAHRREQEEAEKSRLEAEKIRLETEKSRFEAEKARLEAEGHREIIEALERRGAKTRERMSLEERRLRRQERYLKGLRKVRWRQARNQNQKIEEEISR